MEVDAIVKECLTGTGTPHTCGHHRERCHASMFASREIGCQRRKMLRRGGARLDWLP